MSPVGSGRAVPHNRGAWPTRCLGASIFSDNLNLQPLESSDIKVDSIVRNEHKREMVDERTDSEHQPARLSNWTISCTFTLAWYSGSLSSPSRAATISLGDTEEGERKLGELGEKTSRRKD
jgi:hypothetical protein